MAPNACQIVHSTPVRKHWYLSFENRHVKDNLNVVSYGVFVCCYTLPVPEVNHSALNSLRDYIA